ncbi:uncharacterized protein B0T23DRAFT_391819 [Neurospora hispaniola]|uniref:Uncharacterized protein n=1 Tax=Neurospora hispaniola TaxID=588809 RepID=A0AAJ0IEZ6_9PEZI|nr:hypothetical protein B0T23DRAFT_391819 [Neurospora hispaniola]
MLPDGDALLWRSSLVLASGRSDDSSVHFPTHTRHSQASLIQEQVGTGAVVISILMTMSPLLAPVLPLSDIGLSLLPRSWHSGVPRRRAQSTSSTILRGVMARVSPRSPHGVVPVEGIAEVALTGTQQQPPGSNLLSPVETLEPYPQPSHRNGNGQRASNRPGRKTARSPLRTAHDHQTGCKLKCRAQTESSA